MIGKRKLLFLVFLTFIAQGCASTRQFVAVPKIPTTEDSDMGRIYFVRSHRAFTSDIPSDVYDGESHIGLLTPRGYLSWERAPGSAEIHSEGLHSTVINIPVEKGKSHYIEERLHWMGRPSLFLVDKDRGESLMKGKSPPLYNLAQTKNWEERGQKLPPFYDDKWKGANALRIMFGIGQGWLAQIEHETPLSQSRNGSTGLQFGVGYYRATSAKIKVRHPNGEIRSGDLEVNAFPLSISSFIYRSSGGNSAKAGIGVSAYRFDGNIDLHDGGDLYKGDGFGANLLFPFESIVFLRNGSAILQLDLLFQLPILGSNFENHFGRTSKFSPYSGVFFGLTFARKYGG